MNNESNQNNDIADRLLNADKSPTAGPQNLLDEIINQEKVFETRVRKVAIFAWAVTFSSLPLAGVMSIVSRNGSDAVQDAGRIGLVVLGIIGILGLFGATLTTISWLFRSRTPSLRVIEQRLAALEALLMARNI